MNTRIIILLVLFTLIGFAFKTKTTVQQKKSEKSVQSAVFQKMITAKVFIKTGKESEFLSAAKVIVANTNKEGGCLGYMVYQDPYEKTNFIFVERYKNQAAIDAHFAAPYFKEFGTKISDMTSKPTEIKIFDIAGEK